MLKETKGALINYEENRSLIQSNTNLSVNKIQIKNMYLSVTYNGNISLQRLQAEFWGGLQWRLEVLAHHLLNMTFRVMMAKPFALIFPISWLQQYKVKGTERFVSYPQEGCCWNFCFIWCLQIQGRCWWNWRRSRKRPQKLLRDWKTCLLRKKTRDLTYLVCSDVCRPGRCLLFRHGEERYDS